MTNEDGFSPAPLCRHCRDVVGVYEPLIVETPTEWRETSLAAEPRLPVGAAAVYHRICYELAYGDVR